MVARGRGRANLTPRLGDLELPKRLTERLLVLPLRDERQARHPNDDAARERQHAES